MIDVSYETNHSYDILYHKIGINFSKEHKSIQNDEKKIYI